MSSYQYYLSDEEISAHESAMQAVRDKRAAAEQGLRDEIERLQNELGERLAREVKLMHEQEELELESLIVERERRIVLRRIYNEAPNDIVELILKLFSDFVFSDVDKIGWGNGGMNVLRLVSKRLMGVVESCATRLTQLDINGPDSLPLALRRYKRIQHINCDSSNLRSLEGCPDGLKSLNITNGYSLESLEQLRGCIQLGSLEISGAFLISDLGPLNSCPRLKKLTIRDSEVTDISALSSMPLLEELDLFNDDLLDLYKDDDMPSIKDLSPLAHCKMLRRLIIRDNQDIEDISPLAQCTQLEELNLRNLVQISDLKPLSSLTKLKELNIQNVFVKDFTPLSALRDLKEIYCQGIPPTTSHLPLARCSKLKMLYCDEGDKDLDLLRERRSDIEIDAYADEEEGDEDLEEEDEEEDEEWEELLV